MKKHMIFHTLFCLAILSLKLTQVVNAQELTLMVEGITMTPNMGTIYISPFVSDWIRESTVSITVAQNPIFPLAGRVNMVFFARLMNSRDEIIAESVNDHSTHYARYQTHTFRVGDLSVNYNSVQLNFMAVGPSEGALNFNHPYTENYRLPGGQYSLRVTVWKYVDGSELTQISDEESYTFELPPDEDDLQLQVTVNERSPFFIEWQNNPNAAEIQITNRWQRRYEVYMDARIDDGRGMVAETNPQAGLRVPPIIIPAIANHPLPSSSIPFFNRDLDPAVRNDFFHFRDDVDEYRRLGRLPEGFDYRLCVQLRDYSNNNDIIRGIYNCSDQFRIEFPPAPVLLRPDQEEITDRLLGFQWDHEIPAEHRSSVNYTLQIKEVPPSGDVTPDIFNRFDRGNDIELTSLTTLFYQFLVPDIRLLEGHRYAWRVRGYTPLLHPPIRFQGEGWSEVWTFYYIRQPNIPVPVLELPSNGSTVSLPQTLEWSDVRLHDGSSARYVLKIKEVPGGITPTQDFLEQSQGVENVNVDESQFRLPDNRFHINEGRTYAWQVRAFDPAGRQESVFDNNGLSELWTFTVGSIAGGGGDDAIQLVYPYEGDHIPDRYPPFVANLFFDHDRIKKILLRIEELERPDGGARGIVFEDSIKIVLPSSPVLLLNEYGPGGNIPQGQPLFQGRAWQITPGAHCRWTLEVYEDPQSDQKRTSSARFITAPIAELVQPAQGSEIDARSDQLSYRVLRPTAGDPLGFAPGSLHPLREDHFVMNPVIRRADDNDATIRFQTNNDLEYTYHQGEFRFEHSEEFPQLPDGNYRWIVNTKFGDRIVATSEPVEFTIVGSGFPCTGSCVCVEGIYPVSTNDPNQLIPFNGEGRFSIGFRPLVNVAGIRGGTIRVWIRRGLEGHAETEARAADFVGRFTSEDLTSRGDAADLSAFDVDLRNDAGEHIQLLPETHYMWRIDVDIDPARIRRDATSCNAGLTSIQSAQLFFSTMQEVECSEPCVCVSPVSPAVNATDVTPIEDARFTLRLDPPVNEDALRRGTIRIWLRQGNESAEVTANRDPVFTGTFNSFTRIETPFLSTEFEVEPHNIGGDGFTLVAGNTYLWSAEVEYDPNSVRHDGVHCFESHDHSSSDSVFFTVRSRPPEVECNPPIVNRTHPPPGSPLPNEVRIGGYTMTFVRDECRLNDNGRITGSEGRSLGIGTVRTPDGNWSVEFTELEINSDNEVISGRAVARVRDDIPAPLQQALSTGASLTADQIRSLNQLWHNGGTLLESIVGERRVPLGYTLDADFAGAAASGGWGFKAAITHVTFEPTLANCDIAVGLRMPVETNEGETTQWIGLYAQDIPRCLAPDTRWRVALRLLGDITFGSSSMTDWEFFLKHSEREEMPLDYTLQPGDGTAMVISERGVEQVHIEAGIRVPRSILVPQQESAPGSGVWQDVPVGAHGQVELNGTFDYTREGRVISEEGTRPPDQLGGGFYLITDLPRSRVASTSVRIAARECVIDQSTSWSPHADAGADYSVPGLGVGAFHTRGAGFNRPPEWMGYFIKEGTIDVPAIGTPLGIRNAFSSSPMSFTAFASPMAEVQIGESFTARLDTIDFEIDRGNFVRARIVTSMTFPGAMEGRVGLDFVYQQIPEDGNRHEADAFIVSLNAREDERFRITDYISFTIKRGSQMNITYTDPPLRRGGSRWGFIMDLSGGLKFNKRNDQGDDVVSIGGIDFEHLKFETDGRGVQPPRITFFGVEIPQDTSRGGAGEPRGDDAERKRQSVGGFPIGLRSLDLTFGDDGISMGIGAVLTLALTGEASEGEHGGPVFGGSIGFALDGMLEMLDGRLRWQAPTFRLTSLGIDFQSSALTIQGEVAFYDNDRTWGTGFSGELSVSMAKLFTATATLRLGAMETYRYWFIKGDVTILVQTSPISIGLVGVFGFIGGAYQHMQVSEVRNASGVVTNVEYTPTADNTFGIMAGVHIGLQGKPSTFHAKILLTARFRDANLTNISLDGKGWFMCDLERECNGRDDSWLEVHLGFDFPESRFHASLAGQIVMDPLLRIDAPAGSVDILFEPDNWHVYIGRGPFDGPESQVISATFFPDFVDIRADSYFQAGTSIDVNIGGIPLRGDGFAAGVRVNIDVGGKFLIFYGRIWGKFQAELAVIRVDEGGSSCITGANGWYALANLNLALGLEVGIDVDLWFISGRFEIFSAELGVDLLLGGPSPTFVDGDAHGSFRILSGLISGSFHYHLHIGDEVPRDCITEAVDAQFRMPEPIVSVSPPEGERNVSVFTTVGLGFALPEHSEITVRREGQPVRARFVLQTPLDIRPEGGAIVSGGLSVSRDGLSAEWTTEDVLLPDTRYVVNAVAIAQEFQGGRWVETRRQTKRWNFRTGPRPRDVYDPHLLSYTYPLKEQRYSYIRGHDGKHYVHLKRNTDYLFTHMDPTQFLIAQYTDQNNVKHETPLRYEAYRSGCGAFLVVDNPPVEANTIYHLRFIKRTDPDYRQVMIRMETAQNRNAENSQNRNVENRFTEENFSANMTNYRQVTAFERQRARQFALQSGGDLRRFETGAGSYLIERREGNANSRVMRNGRIIDSVMYDWFFGVGKYEIPTAKFSDVTASYKSRLGGFIFFELTSEEPIDDDLSASVFIRKRNASTTTTVNNWFEHLVMNDQLARSKDVLVSNIGQHDADVVDDYVLTTDSRLPINTITYVDAMAPWNFSGTNYSHYRLADFEMEFEERTNETPSSPIPQGGFQVGGLGMGNMRAPAIPIEITGYTDNLMICPLNAIMDFDAMTWRYQNVLTRRIPWILGARVPISVLIYPESAVALSEIGDRSWQTQPSGGYRIGILFKPPNWRLQSYTEGRNNGQIEDTRRLDRVSEFGRASVIGFGEISCGDPGTIPFKVLSLSIP